jgi:hypothetical protein
MPGFCEHDRDLAVSIKTGNSLVAHLVEALFYKSKDRGFETRLVELSSFFFSLPNPSSRTRPLGLLGF